MQKNQKLRTLLFLVLNFIIVFAVYQLCLHMEWMAGTYVYIAAAAVRAVAYYIVNRGFGQPITDEAALPEAWSAEEKCAYIKDVRARHERAKKLLYWLFPIVITLMIDVLDLFVLDSLRGIFTASVLPL